MIYLSQRRNIMNKNSLISITTIKMLAELTNRKQKELQRNAILSIQRNNEKEKPPQYQLVNVEFNSTSRVTRIEILQTQQYRTILKYITRNYQKIPVYSEWKNKEKDAF